MHLPEPLYRAAPYLYVIIGALVALLIHHPAGVLGAILLEIIGLYIFNARITRRIRRHEIGIYRRCEMAHTCDNRVN